MSKTKKQKVHFAKPEEKSELYFYPKSTLEEYDKKLLLWSENGYDHEILEQMLKNGEFFHFFMFGRTGEGKSNVLEIFAEYFHNEHGNVIIDASGNDFEGCFWARKYKCYFVYPQLIKPQKKNKNPNVIEVKLNKKNTWKSIIRRAKIHKRIVVLMCEDPLENSYLKALISLFKACLTRELATIPKICLLREISFYGYKQGQLKLSDSESAKLAKRHFLKYVRTGRMRCNQIFSDAQGLGDIDNVIGDNIAVKGIKQIEGKVKDVDPYVSDAINALEKHQVVFKVKGKIITGTIALSTFHKEPGEKVESLNVFPKTVELHQYNKIVENRYIDRVCEHFTNKLNRLIIGRRRHLQDPDNSELCMFEIADLLALDTRLTFDGYTPEIIHLKNPKLIYCEIKFRNSSSHPRIEISDVKKTIQDLAVKKITWNYRKECYLWTIDEDISRVLNWKLEQELVQIPVEIEMISPNGASKGALALMKKHGIKNRTVKINAETFYD